MPASRRQGAQRRPVGARRRKAWPVPSDRTEPIRPGPARSHLDTPALALRAGLGLPAAPTGGRIMRAFIFPGQGSQSVGMGAALAEASRDARAVFEEVDEALSQNLSRLMAEGPAEELILTENAQPAIMANALATLRASGIDLAPRPISSPATASANIRRCARPTRSISPPPPACSSCAAGRCRRRCRSGEGAMAALLGADLAIAAGGRPRRRPQGEICTVANDNDPVAGRHLRPQGGDRAGARDREGEGRQARHPAARLRALPLPADAARRRGDGRRRWPTRAMEPPPCRSTPTSPPRRSTDPDDDPRAARRAGHRHGPLARKRRRHGRSRRHPFRRVRRQGPLADGQAHRPRRADHQRHLDGRHRRAGEGALTGH